MIKLGITFLAGLLAGLAASWTVIRSLRARIKFYETYIHDRIAKISESSVEGRSVEAVDPRNAKAANPEGKPPSV